MMIKTFNHDSYLKEAHLASFANKKSLKKDKVCGCFHCLKIFDPKEIKKYIPERGLLSIITGESTAVCPHCGTDSVLGENSGFPITKEFLTEMKNHFF